MSRVEIEAGRIVVMISAEIYDAMERLGISQNEMAKRIGCTRGHLSNILNGRNLLSLPMMIKIGEACGGWWDISLESYE